MIHEYLKNSSIHGLRYISQSERHWTEKIFWFAACLVSLCGTVILVLASWQNFQKDAVSFVVDTNYVHWNTTFPAISVCEVLNHERLIQFIEKNYPYVSPPNNSQFMDMMTDIAFFDGKCRTCESNIKSSFEWPKDGLYELAVKIRMECKELIKDCKWNDKKFDCCATFKILNTEMGPCFSFNSFQANSFSTLTKVFISNRMTGPGHLEFQLHGESKLYIHAPEDIPYWNTPDNENVIMQKGSTIIRRIMITEIENEPEVRDLTIEQRQCRMQDEVEQSSLFPCHSYSSCVLVCRMKLMMDMCNCTHHLLPNTSFSVPCQKKGINCIATNNSPLKGLLQPREDNPNAVYDCPCLSSCTEPDYRFVYSPAWEDKQSSNTNISTIDIMLNALPSDRLKRIVVRGPLDLVVSIGGIVGLFLGASLLSVVELLYYFIVQPCYNYFYL